MINSISVKNELEKNSSQKEKYITLPFYSGGKPLESLPGEKHARWGMTLLAAGTMRFRWNEKNENRNLILRQILNEIKKPVCTGNCSSEREICDCKLKPVPVELIHSKIIFEAKNEGDTKNLQGDGIVTQNPLLVPVVTVADCVPVFLYDRETKAIGAFHSGWKGTGIAGEGVEKLTALYGSKKENICAAIGPHIGNCCYFVDEERADYFMKNFGEKCVEKAVSFKTLEDEELAKRFPYRLSLTEANLFVLKNAGIPEENIVVADDCTCCTEFASGENVFGSFRRQAAFLPQSLTAEERSRQMCVQAAFVTIF
ncbi:MAG: polyphenol oxidase family protein [Treponema sp.]|nr:polyphenol oxidase family protein [Treponema sp.]